MGCVGHHRFRLHLVCGIEALVVCERCGEVRQSIVKTSGGKSLSKLLGGEDE